MGRRNTNKIDSTRTIQQDLAREAIESVKVQSLEDGIDHEGVDESTEDHTLESDEAPVAETNAHVEAKPRAPRGEGTVLPDGRRRLMIAITIPEAAYKKLMRTADGRTLTCWVTRLFLRALSSTPDVEEEPNF